jgi:hypothetical protein
MLTIIRNQYPALPHDRHRVIRLWLFSCQCPTFTERNSNLKRIALLLELTIASPLLVVVVSLPALPEYDHVMATGEFAVIIPVLLVRILTILNMPGTETRVLQRPNTVEKLLHVTY